MRFHFLIYFDPSQVFDDSPASNALLAQIGPHTAELERRGHLILAQPLNLPREAITVCMRDGKMATTDGPFAETREALGGLLLIEARDLDEAKQLAAELPHAHVGHIEIRPVIDYTRPRPKL